jgi:hypothetical protein
MVLIATDSSTTPDELILEEMVDLVAVPSPSAPVGFRPYTLDALYPDGT